MPSISFQTFFVWAFKIVVDSWEFSILLLYILWDDWPIFHEFRFEGTDTTGIGIHPTKPWLSLLVNLKVQSGTLEEGYAIKFCFELGKMPQKRMECFRLLFDHLSGIEHQFLSGIRDSRKAGCLGGMVRGVGGVSKAIHQNWLAKGLGLGLLCWGFKGVQEEIGSEEANTLQIGSVAFPPGQYTSPQLYPCHRLFDQDGHHDSSSPSI